MKKKIYIAGPMTGHHDHNFPAFHAEAARLRRLGYDVVNPAELNPNWDGATHQACLKRDIAGLLNCDEIRLLAGWRKSRGAQLELFIADAIGIPHTEQGELSYVWLDEQFDAEAALAKKGTSS